MTDRDAYQQDLIRELLVSLGEDPGREGLADTPRRMLTWLREWTGEYRPGNLDTTFEAVQADQMVVVSGVEVWSLCEHHLLPFRVILSMGYVTGGRVLGLSKFARIAHQHAHRLQLQERLCHDIADDISSLANVPDVAVVGEGEHLCMTMRGIRTPGRMVTSVMRGAFQQERTRLEFMHLSGGSS